MGPDRYTLGNAAIGYLFGLRDFPAWAILAGAVAWELLDDGARGMIGGPFPPTRRETVVHGAVDVAATLAGWYVARSLAREAE